MKTVKKVSVRPREGDFYSIHLNDGRYAIGVLARVETIAPRKPYAIFVYFFAPFDDPDYVLRHPEILLPQNRTARLKTGALGIYAGDWIRLGALENWDRDKWEFPYFIEGGSPEGWVYRIRLNEDDLGRIAERVQVYNYEGIEMNILYGHVSASNHVCRLVRDQPSIDTLSIG